MSSYEDNLIGLDDQNEFKQFMSLVRAEPNRSNNLDDIFAMIINKASNTEQRSDLKKLTQQDLCKLDSFGTTLASEDRLFAAQYCFEKILAIDPNYLKSYQNLDNVKNQLVERWHFGMLNDANRNRKYRAAIAKALQQKNEVNVLDIGTGTGLLAMYAHEQGAARTIACDYSPIMCHIASETFRRNGCADQIKLIPKHSTKLNADADLGGKVDLIVTETMDCAVFGEGLLETLIHAKENLLKSNGQIIPARVKLYVAGFQSRQIAMETNVVNSSCFTDTIYLQNHSLSSSTPEPYDSVHIDHIRDLVIITRIEEALNVNLNNLDEFHDLDNGVFKKNVRLLILNPESLLDGFCVWFKMSLDPEETITYTTDPTIRNASSEEETCCWQSAIYRLKHRFTNSQRLQNLNVTISAENGVLKLDHYYDAYGKTYTGLTTDMVKFLNDTELINALEFDVFAEIQRRFGEKRPVSIMGRQKVANPEKVVNIGNMLDFSLLPTVGIALLKERRLKMLYCSKDAKDPVTFIATANCISLESIVFINDPSDILLLNEKFDVIILPLVECCGALNSSLVANYGILKENKLSSRGFILPEQVEVMCNVIHSGWLRAASRVIDPDVVDRLMIGSTINEYATTLHLDLNEDYIIHNLYEAYRAANVQLNDGYYEIEHKLYLGDDNSAGAEAKSNLAIHGAMFYFNILLTQTSKSVISTRRKNLFARLACFIFNENDVHKENGFITLKFRQNSGVMKIDIK